MVAVVAALEAELKPLRKRVVGAKKESEGLFTVGRIGRCEVLLVKSGMGRKSSERAVALLTEKNRPDAFLSTGFAGALRDDVRTGHVVLANRLIPIHLDRKSDPQDVPIYTDGKILALAAKALEGVDVKYHVGAILTLNRVADAAEKPELGQLYPALSVDMESYFIAKAAAAHHIPFLAARVVLDEVGDDLPLPKGLLSEDGRFRMLEALSYLATNPGSILGLVRLAKQATAASKAIGLVVEPLSRVLTPL
jgi:adenosylhomocysteine nucleosidase